MSQEALEQQLQKYGYYETLESFSQKVRAGTNVSSNGKLVRFSPGDFFVSQDQSRFDSYLRATKSGTPYVSIFEIPKSFLGDVPATNEDKVRYDVYRNTSHSHLIKAEINISFSAGLYKDRKTLSNNQLRSLDSLSKFVGIVGEADLFSYIMVEKFPYQDSCDYLTHVRQILAVATSHGHLTLSNLIVTTYNNNLELIRIRVYNLLNLGDFIVEYHNYKDVIDGSRFYEQRSSYWKPDVFVNRKYHVLYKLIVETQNFAGAYYLIKSQNYPLDNLVYALVQSELRNIMKSPGLAMLILALENLANERQVQIDKVNKMAEYLRDFLSLALST